MAYAVFYGRDAAMAEKRKNVFRYARKDLPARHIMEDLFGIVKCIFFRFICIRIRYRRKV